ncbi:chromosomal replication initiator protein DnaA [soil metagenome]
MANLNLQELWHTVTSPLLDTFDARVFNPIVKPGSIISLSVDELRISVDNPMGKQFFRKYCETRVLENIEKETGISPAKVTYVIRPVNRERMKPTIESGEPQLFQSSKERGHTGELVANPQIASNLNTKYTFKSFITGTKNRLAFAAAQAVAESPGNLYNPLYLYGGVGLGKTHIMQAVGNAVIERDPNKKVLYVACENFLNEFVTAIKKGSPDSFKKKYRNIDVFLVDDIQFIGGKDGVQEEFFHTFNELHQAGKQIVMTSDKRPSEIKGLEERLMSRFSMGMVTDIQLPDQSTRLAILQTKCQEKGISLPENILRFVADEVETNIRELEGALTTLVAHLHAQQGDLSIETTRTVLHGIISQHTTPRKSKVDVLCEIICTQYGVQKEAVLSSARQREIVRPRQVLMYLLKHEVGMTYPMIGREIGGRDHTTIMHGVDKITTELKKNPELLEELQGIKLSFYDSK